MAPRKRQPIERFMEKVEKTPNGCWEWRAYRGGNGYGRFYFEGRGALAHRWAYEYYRGAILDGLVIDHLCRNHGCVNPDHLEPVTPQQNVLRGDGPRILSERRSGITECSNGHEFTAESMYTSPSGRRECLTCKKARARRHYEAERFEAIARAAEWRDGNRERYREIVRESSSRYRARKREQRSGHLIND